MALDLLVNHFFGPGRSLPICVDSHWYLFSCTVPNLAMSLFFSVTMALPGSNIVDVFGLTLLVPETGARTS